MKLFHKIAVTTLGIVMATAVGAGLIHHNRNDVKMARAADVSIINVFNADTMQTSISNYTSTWTNSSGLDLELENFNNNKKAWEAVKAGRKDYTSVAKITTEDSVSNTIKQVKVTVDSIAVDKVNSANLYVSSTGVFAGEETEIEPDAIKSGVMTYSIASPAANKYYQLVYDLQKSSNGFLAISRIEYVYESSATLQSIALQKDNETVKTVYYDGDNVSFTGIKAIGTYSDTTQADLTSSCTITADKVKVATGDTSITYSAVYNGAESITIQDFVLSITTHALAITKVEKNGNYRIDFVQKQKFSYGTGTLKVTYNSGATTTINPTAAGVTAAIGSLDITGKTHYMTMDDDGENLVLSYAGFNVNIGTISVTPYVEPEAGYWSPITSTSDLVDGLEVIIVASGHEFSMGKYTTGNNVMAVYTSKDGEGKISSSIPGVQVYTLEESTVVDGTFAFSDGSSYLAATGGTSSNYLKVENEITSKSSFAITISAGVMTIVGKGSTASGARMTMRYNDSDEVFSCYGSTATTGSLACLYKFTAQSKSEDQIAVENFCKTSLHLDDTQPDYIDPNDVSGGTDCQGVGGYYALAKAAYLSMIEVVARKEIFASSSDTLIVWGRARLSAWATANNEVFDPAAGTFTPVVQSSVAYSNAVTKNTTTIIIVVASIASISLAGFFLVLRKRKEQ